MAIDTVIYPTPIRVHGFSCKNCSEADMSAKNIDPAHPRSGPNNVDAASDPTRNATDPIKVAAAKKMADTARTDVAGYSRSGVQTGSVAAGLAFSLNA